MEYRQTGTETWHDVSEHFSTFMTMVRAENQKATKLEKLIQKVAACRERLDALVCESGRLYENLEIANGENDDTMGYEYVEMLDENHIETGEVMSQLETALDKLLRAGLRFMAERWDFLVAGDDYRVRNRDLWLAAIEAALGSEYKSEQTDTNYIEL